MPAEDNRSGAEAGLGKPPADHYSLDTLAKGLASDSVSRGQALRMIGSALAGAALALFVPGVARARQDGPVDFGPQGPVDRVLALNFAFLRGMIVRLGAPVHI
jgi:hypothetical protein